WNENDQCSEDDGPAERRVRHQIQSRRPARIHHHLAQVAQTCLDDRVDARQDEQPRDRMPRTTDRNRQAHREEDEEGTGQRDGFAERTLTPAGEVNPDESHEGNPHDDAQSPERRLCEWRLPFCRIHRSPPDMTSGSHSWTNLGCTVPDATETKRWPTS